MHPSVYVQLPGQILELASRRSSADQHQVHILLQTLQCAQRHGVILHRRETGHNANHEGTWRNPPTALPGAAHLDGDVTEGALLQEIRQLKDALRRHALVICQQLYPERTVGDHAVRVTIAPTIEWYQTRSRGRIEPTAAGNDTAAG